MTEASTKAKRPMPKGGRKGGTSFPRVSLADSLGYAKKLLAKTHTGPQPQDVIFAGVVGAKSGTGQVRISALKQYGLLKGDAKANYTAEELAKQIGGAPQDELQPLLRKAALRPAVFKKVFDAFHGDVVTKAKLRQRVIDLHVHPEEADTCVSLYISGMTTAGLVAVDGDKVAHVASKDVDKAIPTATCDQSADSEPDKHEHKEPEAVESDSAEIDLPAQRTAPENGSEGDANKGSRSQQAPSSAPRAVFHVNVTLDSSLDTEKLQKQLELLKRFGAL
jgi:hypothetical protein